METKHCGICESRLKKTDGKNKIKAEKLWPKVQKLAEYRNTSYEQQRYICDKCRCPLIKTMLPIDPVAAADFQFMVDPIIKKGKKPNNLIKWRNKENIVELNHDFEIDTNEDLETNTSSNTSDSITVASGSSIQVTQSSQVLSSQSTESSNAVSSQMTESSQSISSTVTESSHVSSVSSQLNSAMFNINIPSCSSSQRCCFICRNTSGRTSISAKARVDAFLKRKIIIPETNRCCTAHLNSNGYFTAEALINITASSETTIMTPENISTFLINISETQNRNSKPMLNFEDDTFSEVEFKMLTGLTREHFEETFNSISAFLRDSKNRSSKNSLAMFFVKLRLNLPQTVLALLFGFPNQERVSENFNRVMDILHERFVPLHLGYNHITRAEAKISHQALIATEIHEIPQESLGYTLDGTYLPCEKPSSLPAQRALWSVQKGCTLVKPMMITFTDGYILEMPNCFPGKTNDATILNTMLEWKNSILSFTKSGDFFIVDRGFRDSIKPLEEKNINVIMPPLLAQGQHKFTTDEANRMRLVTMARFVVEVVNGRIKMKFKFFNDTLKATYLPKITKLFRIACAVMNAFGAPIISNPTDGQAIIDAALRRNVCINELSEYVRIEGLEPKRVIWELASKETIESFPVLTLDDMKKITLGSYQTNLATRYIRQHLSATAEYQIFVHKERHDLLRAKLQSRFRASAYHQLWIEFIPRQNGHESISGYVCTCRVGDRTVGTCAHVTSVIYFLGYCRYNTDNLPKVRDLVSSILNSLDQH